MEDSDVPVRTAPAKKKKLSGKKVLVVLLVLVLLAGVGVLAWQYVKARNDVERLANPQESAKLEVEILQERVSKLVEVPDETPTVATVTDASKVKQQPFFAQAENGDKVLIYTQAKRAILYRPSTNKVIEVAPINLGNQ